MKKILFLIALVVLAALVWGYYQGYYQLPSGVEVPSIFETKTETPQAPTETTERVRPPYTVEITDIGFKPDKLNILNGDTVIFVNRGNRDHWPASGVHPEHKLCPGFDAFHGLVHNEEYSYTFNFAAPRTCPFHDHLDPTLKGFINIVNQ